MPFDHLDPLETSVPDDFTIQERETVVGETQANVTFRVTTRGHRPLGNRGELSGIAKLDPVEAQQHLEQARDRAMEDAMTRLGQIATEINETLNTDNALTEDQRRQLEQRRNWILGKVNSGNRTIVRMDLPALGPHATEEVFQRAVTMHGQVVTLTQNQNINATLGIQGTEEGGTAMLTRAVGTSKLDQLLGTNVISEERFGVDEQGRPIGISVRVDGFGVIGKLSGNREYELDIDYSRHEVQKGLYDLEVIDYITGQIDRHPGNIFIDPETGEVRGIDNDLCFPSLSREEMLEGLGEAQGKPVFNKPLFMHEDTARKIEELTPESLRETLSSLKYPEGQGRGKLTPGEIEGAVTRLNELKEHVQDLRRTNHVVTEFTKATHNEAIQHQKDSYARQNGNALKEASRSLDTLDDARMIESTNKTSYIGSIYCEQLRTNFAIEEGARVRLNPEGVRTETQSTGKSTRSEEHLEFARLEKERRPELRATEKEPMQDAFDRADERLARMERRLERLEHPNLWDRFKAIWHGGVEGAKRAFEGKRQDALEQIHGLNRVLEQNVNLGLQNESGGRWERAQENVQNRRLQEQQGNNVGLNQSQKVDVNLGEDVDGRLLLNPEKLGMVDTTPHKPGFVLKDSSEISIDDGENVELNKQSSVRDLMKSRDGGDKEPKVKNELEIDDDTVRSQVGVKKTDTTTQKGQSFRTQ
ncbi:phosphatidylinositol 3-/4-kinase [Roseimicrobium gellanilyticum]|uniref:Phosphatidylinositol 3-/4-kinase n=1 Tax=Roseimicrobium gellanilyticum TaxID=748857 RepID=A0A366H3Q5_9BACT|nr:hypothetical protein [Roseimicrobium gellanilyticum]RBP36610.1 phosphatidylinositol 3-/4-kinase [Roseimicrobium gellanilyticum]